MGMRKYDSVKGCQLTSCELPLPKHLKSQMEVGLALGVGVCELCLNSLQAVQGSLSPHEILNNF